MRRERVPVPGCRNRFGEAEPDLPVVGIDRAAAHPTSLFVHILTLAHRRGGPYSSAASAPRGALLYPRLSREELEGRFLGLMADLDPKGEGDNSMPGK